ncbi:hypothetical protein HG530_000921 [Fusarium avenaceum]|nr:hypothetical protein HG530_000921 [Fusarium avenaceum]
MARETSYGSDYANSTEDDNVTPDTLISKNTNTAASVKTSEGLGHLMACLAYIHIRMCNATYLVVKTSLPDHVDEDVVSLSGDLNSLLGDIAKNSDSDSRAAFNRVSQHSKHRYSVPCRNHSTLPEFGVFSASFSILEAFLLLEHVDDFGTVSIHCCKPIKDNPENTLKTTQEQVTSLDDSKVDAKVVPEVLLDLLELVETHAAVVHTDSDESVSNGLSHQSRSYSAVDTSAYATNNEGFGTNKLPDASNLELDKVAHLPVCLGSANVDAEVEEEIGSTWGLNLNVRAGFNLRPKRDKRVRARDGIGHLVILNAVSHSSEEPVGMSVDFGDGNVRMAIFCEKRQK